MDLQCLGSGNGWSQSLELSVVLFLGGLEYSLHQVEILCGDTERGILFFLFFGMFLLENVTQKTGLFCLLLLYFEIQSVLFCFDSNSQTS